MTHDTSSVWYDLASHQMVDKKYHLLEDSQKPRDLDFRDTL